jgi:phytoene dehydrogenase-like protein
VAGESVGSLKFTVYNFDPTLAPEGRTVIKVRISSPFGYWKELVKNRPAYDAEKDRIARDVIQRLDQRFPGLSDEVEMVDVATPVTFERYTGNWQASFEGFLPTPKTMTASIPLTLPGLENLHMAGQWVRVGGGIPTGVATGREAIIRICRKDGVKFQGA